MRGMKKEDFTDSLEGQLIRMGFILDDGVYVKKGGELLGRKNLLTTAEMDNYQLFVRYYPKKHVHYGMIMEYRSLCGHTVVELLEERLRGYGL